MNVSAWAIRNPLPSILLFVVLLGLGLLSFRSLPITYFPNIDVPVVTVTITDTGASPQEIETAITQAVEDAVANLVGIRELSSSIGEGESTTTVEFELGVPIDRAVADVRDAVSTIRSDLPVSIDEPIIGRVDVESGAVVTYAVSDRAMTREELSFFVDDVVMRKLRGLSGIGQIERTGGVSREIQVRLDPDRLLALGITASQVNAQLGGLAIDASGGTTRAGGIDRALSTLGAVTSLDELAAIDIVLANGSTASLADLGSIADTHAEPDGFAALDEREVVGFSVFRARGASDVGVAQAVAVALEELSRDHPGAQFSLIDDSVTYTLGNYDAAMNMLIEGAFLAMAVVFLFLRDWRATLVAAAALPLAAIPTFWAMDLLGFSLNIISLLGITLVAGILVDDAIVEIENIARHGAMGKTAREAAIDASDEIGMAVIAISATIIAVFVPVGFMGGVVGQYFREFGLTVAIAVFFSLLAARLITPLLAARLMRMRPEIHRPPGMAGRAYGRLVRLAVGWPGTTVAVAIVLFAVSILAARGLPTEFLPPDDNGKIQISVELPPGSTLDETRLVSNAISQEVRALDNVAQVFVRGGIDATGRREIRRAAVLVVLRPKGERTQTVWQVEALVADLLRGVPDIRFELLNSRGGRDVSVSVLSRDGPAASEAAAMIMAELSSAPFAVGESSSETAARPELRIRPRPERMADMGVTTAGIAETVRVSTIGAAARDLADFREGERRIPIRLQLNQAARDDMDTLGSLLVPTVSGGVVPLSQVAEIEIGNRVSQIERFDRQRLIDIGFDTVAGMTAGEGLRALWSLPSVGAVPAGVSVVASGDSDTQGDVFASFGVAMGAGITLVLIVLILLFNSLLTPVTILATLPLSAGGVVLALMATGTAVSLPVVIGILMLMGIVTKNAIMLVDFAVEHERKGMSRRDASIAAGIERARPIIMTTLAMSAGMVPAALGIGDGGSIRSPMAIAVIGGLIVSTLLSLVVVPALHCLLGDLAGKAGALTVGRRREDTPLPAPRDHPAPPGTAA
ncbi:efflux RND transporter permease subunit [Aureimonas populi]|uniref:Efflux RND transporter permease subunit n=1 Tax=Aureimonas populi TaxID=1701758 RepID=A0ABW5CL61_9HYPH|nr:efflux RND transporter permease subunit [Aureimonas populi]